MYQASPDRYMCGMNYKRCGKSGVLLPRISLGLWHNFGVTTPFERSRQILLTAFDHGVTHIDLANNYGPEPGEAERRFGQILHDDLGGHRDELFVSTKAAYDMWEGPYGNWGSRKHLMASLDQSLRRMKVDYVDLFYCHRYDPETPLEETLQALADIVRSGKALYIGISRWPSDALRFAQEYLDGQHSPMLIIQDRLNLLSRAPLEQGILGYANQTGTGFIAFSPLAQGLLSDRYLNGIPQGSRMCEERFLRSSSLTPALMRQLRELNDVALQRGQTLAQMALTWVLQQAGTTSVLVGASSQEQLVQNIHAQDAAPLSDDELVSIEEILRG